MEQEAYAKGGVKIGVKTGRKLRARGFIIYWSFAI